MTASQPPPLPVRPRPRHGETADSYLRRLAAANHLRFSHLRRYLSTPEGSYGPVDPGRLAAVAGRELPAILHTLTGLAPAARPPARRYAEEDIQRNHPARQAKYAAIRRDAHRHVRAGHRAQAPRRPPHHRQRPRLCRSASAQEDPPRPRRPGGPARPHRRHDHGNPEDHHRGDLGTPRRRARHHGRLPNPPHLRLQPPSAQAGTRQDQLRPTRIRTTKTMPTATLPQSASVSPKIAQPGQPITTGNFS